MKPFSIKPAALALAMGLALAGLATAQSTPTPAQQKQLDAARAEVERAAKHLAELSNKYGGTGSSIRIERQALRKPVIGVVLAPDDSGGVRIAGVTPDSAAASAGIKSGDRLVSIDGKPINAGTSSGRVDQTREMLASLDAKTPVKLAYDRGGKTQAVVLTPKIADRLLFLPGMEGDADFDGDVRVYNLGDGQVEVIAKRMADDATSSGHDAQQMETIVKRAKVAAGEHALWSAAIAPGVHREVIRLGGDCDGDDCKLPMLAEAFRWNGLNLASVDANLGRYFGATDGVLVLSTGKDLDGLQAGDVIRRIDGKPVNSPREAMEALRAQPAAAKVGVDYLRDRKPGTAQVTVPKALPFRIPPPPPMPPKPPMPPLPPLAPAAPGAPHAVGKHKMVFVDKDGKVTQWEGGAGDTPPAWVSKQMAEGVKGQQERKVVIIDKDGKRTEWQDDGSAPLPPPPDGAKRVEERVMVFVGEDGKRTVISGSEAPPPPPPPPAPPKPPKPPAPSSGG